MRIAVLFDSDNDKYDGSYGDPIRNTILSTRILQKSKRHLKVKIGDVLLYSNARSHAHYTEMAEITYFSHPWQLLNVDAVRSTYMRRTVYCWAIQNVTDPVARSLHEALLADDAYLGMHAIDLTNPAHLVFYRNSLISKYRLKGNTARIFYSMGNEDEKDESEVKALRRLGYRSVDWEDKGAHGTIFDDFDTLDHFQRVEYFRRLLSQYGTGGDDGADDLILMLEDLSPRLFSTLGACARALTLATHEEDLAQAGLSARRYLEQLADALFPAQKESFKGRSVTLEKFRNRLWAYIDSSLPDETVGNGSTLSTLGKEVDRLFEEMNAALHGVPDKARLNKALVDASTLSAALLQLDPEAARKPYFAFQANIMAFFEDVVSDHRK